ncbi:MAG: hypothetical protein ACRDI0_04360 [Actinomycetota bacterium]
MRQLLDAEARRVHGEAGALETIVRRAGRRRRNRRVATAAVALVVAGAGMIGVFTAFGPPGPEAGPGTGGFRGIWPQTTLEEAEIAQSRADHGDDRLTHQLDANIFVHTFARDGLHWTDVTFDPAEEAAANGPGPLGVTVRGCPFDDSPEPQPEGSAPAGSEDCPLEVAVTIERLLRSDPTGIWLVTDVTAPGGEPNVHRSPLPPVDSPSPFGFQPDAPNGVEKVAWEFIEARNGSRPVERYLSPEAERAYEEGDGGLSMYGYTAEAHSLTLWGISEVEDGWRVVGFQGSDGQSPDGDVIRETLLIGPGENVLGQSREWVILAAERNE